MNRKRLGVPLIQTFTSTELQANEFVVSILLLFTTKYLWSVFLPY